MAINETRKDFGLKLLNYYSDSMKIYSKSFDTESINTPRFNK